MRVKTRQRVKGLEYYLAHSQQETIVLLIEIKDNMHDFSKAIMILDVSLEIP